MDTACKTSARSQHDWSNTDPSTAIITTISDLEETAPETMDLVLFDYIDPEGLDTLVSGYDDDDLSVQFRIDGYDIKIVNEQLTVRRTNGTKAD